MGLKMKIGWKRPAVALGAAAVCILLAGMLLVILREKGKTEMETGIYFKKETGNAFFTNDLGITDIGDPFVLKTETDGYYMYCTSAPNGFYCWKSEDLVNWSGKEMCYVRQPDSWCVDCFWAPEVVFYEGKYYMFYTAKNQQDSLRIGLAVSEKPGGPFLDVKNEPLFDFGYAAIDANVLIDADGKKYLYYSRDCSENVVDGLKKSEIYGVPLSDDLLSVQGEAVKLLTPQQKWEKESGDTQWNEGPEMITHEGKYYLTYSANFFASPSYSLGYAVSDSPLGPFVKAEENPLLTSGIRKDVSGTGHHSFTMSPDGTQLWAVYHSHTNPQAPSGNRKVNIDRAGFTADGKLYINGPVTTMQPVPSGAAAVNITNRFIAMANGEKADLLVDGFFSIYKKHADMDMKLEAENGGTVKVTLEADEELPVYAAAIYPGQGGMKDIYSVSLCVDDRICSEEYIVGEEAVSPLLLSFEPVQAEKIDFVFTMREGTDSLKLSEITILQPAESQNRLGK